MHHFQKFQKCSSKIELAMPILTLNLEIFRIGMVGPIFKPHLCNFLKWYIFYRCSNDIITIFWCFQPKISNLIISFCSTGTYAPHCVYVSTLLRGYILLRFAITQKSLGQTLRRQWNIEVWLQNRIYLARLFNVDRASAAPVFLS